MRILYSVAGEGFGHYSRSKEMISALRSKGHKILVMAYGQSYPLLRKQFTTIKLEGFPLIFRNGELSVIRTAIEGTKAIARDMWNFNKIIKKVKKFSPDVCITDYEPFAKFIALYFGLPLISIDNQHVLTKAKIPKNINKKGAFIAKIATLLNPIRADYYIILSLEKKSDKADAFFVSPVVRKEVLRLKPSRGEHIVVYQNKKDISDILKRLPEKFIVYNPDKKGVEGNITFKKISEGFIHDLAKAKAVIGTAGFSLTTEAIYLRKPFFAIPQKGQFEQTLNAYQIKNMGIGDFSESPTEEQLGRFLGKLGVYEKNLKGLKYEPNEALASLSKLLKKL